MDSVDGCCGLRKTDGFQNAQAGSTPNKVDLIIWEIEVPKVRAASSQFPEGQGHQVCGVASEGGTAIQKKPLSEPEAGGRGTPHFAGFAELPAEGSSPRCHQGRPVLVLFQLTGLPASPGAFPLCAQAQICLEMPAKTRLRTWAGQESLHCALLKLSKAECSSN